ncbi:MAG: hypothetical protein K0S11_1345 [Gammaproteobacteria bacterium]|nr:hypothetical protein [Gammaproteobacteria bacterium]
MLPAGADKFYGTGALIQLCQQLGFSYRIRLKGNVTLTHAGSELIGDELVSLNLSDLKSRGFYINQTQLKTAQDGLNAYCAMPCSRLKAYLNYGML